MDHDFSNSDAASPTALASAPITRRSGSLTPLSISTRRHSATPARAASSCWLNPVQRRAAFRLCPRRAPRLAGLLSRSTMSPAFESAKPGEWSGSRLACVWTATDHQGARWHGRWTRRRLVDHACHASKQIIDKPRKLWWQARQSRSSLLPTASRSGSAQHIAYILAQNASQDLRRC